MGAVPGELMFLFLSGRSQPVTVPGSVQLGLGDAGNDLLPLVPTNVEHGLLLP